MTVNSKVLIETSTSDASDYVSSSVYTIIDKCTATNIGILNQSIDVYLLSESQSVGTDTAIISGRVLQPGESYTCPEVVGHVLSPGGSIHIATSTSGEVVTRASGRVIS